MFYEGKDQKLEGRREDIANMNKISPGAEL
jgi:hypothetical protein